jgi:flavin-binding protein dodecin
MSLDVSDGNVTNYRMSLDVSDGNVTNYRMSLDVSVHVSGKEKKTYNKHLI